MTTTPEMRMLYAFLWGVCKDTVLVIALCDITKVTDTSGDLRLFSPFTTEASVKNIYRLKQSTSISNKLNPVERGKKNLNVPSRVFILTQDD